MATSLLRMELAAFVFGLAAIIAYQLLTGRINLSGLFDQVDPASQAHSFSPARVQLLIMTLFGAGYFLSQILEDPSHLPDLPEALLAIQGGSGALYLGFKAFGFQQALSRFAKP